MRRNPGQFTLAALALVCISLLAACSSSTPTLRYITISPTSNTVTVGSSVQFTAQAYYSDGSTKDATSVVSWASSDSTIATVTGGLAAE